MSAASYKRQFKANPTVNPETGRSIKKNSETYKHLTEKYGNPSPKRRKSPVKKSPRKSPRKSMDPFEVLPEESIRRVLGKLSVEHQLAWANSSPKVMRIYRNM